MKLYYWDRKLADMMSSYWVNFAATADPNGRGLPVWPVWTEKDTQVMEFGDKIQIKPLPRQAEVEFWDKVNLRVYRQ
jgi:para-nitrobenzyl esterase